MGQKVSDSATIQADAATIRQIILDLDRYPEWADGVKKVTVLETDAEGNPALAKFDVDAKVAELSYTIRYTLTDASISWVLEEGDMMSQNDGSYVMTPKDGGTHVVYTVEADVSIPLPGFMKKRAAKQIVETGLQGLKKRAEAA